MYSINSKIGEKIGSLIEPAKVVEEPGAQAIEVDKDLELKLYSLEQIVRGKLIWHRNEVINLLGGCDNNLIRLLQNLEVLEDSDEFDLSRPKDQSDSLKDSPLSRDQEEFAKEVIIYLIHHLYLTDERFSLEDSQGHPEIKEIIEVATGEIFNGFIGFNTLLEILKEIGRDQSKRCQLRQILFPTIKYQVDSQGGVDVI